MNTIKREFKFNGSIEVKKEISYWNMEKSIE